MVYIQMVLIKEGKKTNVWEIRTIEECPTPLGYIKWYSSWRKYCFFPLEETIYCPKCLKSIAEFIENEMLQRRK